MKRKKYYVYVISNCKNNKLYIGITSKTISKRLKTHFEDSNHTNPNNKSHLHNAIRKYGKECFKTELLDKAFSWRKVCKLETKYIKMMNTKSPNGYNLTDGGEGAVGIKWNQESRRKASKIRKERWAEEDYRKHICKLNKERWDDPKTRKEQSVRSKNLWKRENYRQKTTLKLKERWNDLEMKERHRKAIIASTRENKEWMLENTKRIRKQAKDPEYLKKLKEGIQNGFKNNPERSQKISKRTKEYWNKGQEKRRKKHSITMSKMIKEKLKDPSYLKWRKNNPPGGKPIQYNFKFFRSMQEAADFFNCDRSTVDRHLMQNKKGCRRLQNCKRKKWPWEIKYD